MSLAGRVKELRESQGLSQIDLAELLKVDRSYIGHVETGRIQLPSREILTALATHLDTSVEDLLIAAGYLSPRAGPLELTDVKLQRYVMRLAALPRKSREALMAVTLPYIEGSQKIVTK